MILSLGVKPLKAAVTVLIANTAPVAFGAVAVPITTAADVGGKDPHVIATIVGHQAPFLAMLVPLILLVILDGMQGLKDAWLPALIIGVSFAIAQWVTAATPAYNLTDVVACIVSMGVAVVFLQFWKRAASQAFVNATACPHRLKRRKLCPPFASGWHCCPTSSSLQSSVLLTCTLA